MKILVIGNGGREDALVWKINKSKKVSKIYVAPGNAGTSKIAENINIRTSDIKLLLAFAQEKQIDLTIVGPEISLVLGIVDLFEKAGLRIFGPNKASARLEGSKSFSKIFMEKNKIPTAKYKEYTSLEVAIEDIGIYGYPMVIKADGLAAGKGVIIAEKRQEAKKALEDIMQDRVFGEAGSKVIFEEFLDGVEASVLCFVDGKTIIPMEAAQDYKKIFDGDKGPNTGGMGTYSPSIIYNEKIKEYVKTEILQRFIAGVNNEGIDFRGILFVGLMIKDNKAKVVEFNVRFGDPETQAILPRMKNDIVEIFEACIDQRLNEIELKWSTKSTVCVVLASGGYPGTYEKDKVITGLEDINSGLIFHAGTILDDHSVLTNGGRVLNIVSIGNTIEDARCEVYKNIDKIVFEGKTFRTDIGLITKKKNELL